MQVLFFINEASVCKYSLEIPFYLHQLFRNRFECIYTRSTKFMFIARALGENNKNKVKVKSVREAKYSIAYSFSFSITHIHNSR